ncbi:peptide ABC transporter permease [Phyllobacterium phragmitis]|uniref:Peptide ABC transporter permease n=1 Tax=Phyllobacterium phragmitis TaxID=2670329 RepID=A0A2S9IQW6_9HYPH|nr:ABC transporter permease [Phyllobacterium phragmitis]PRD42918.1 peptide ABC transporter permease [Phyllobacterium phragmitis]
MTGATRLAIVEKTPVSAPMPLLVKLSILFTLLLVACALSAQWIMPYEVAKTNLLHRFAPPLLFGGDWAHPFGTDNLGRDMLSLVLRAIQVSFLIAFVGTIGGAIIGTILGLIAAWSGGIVDDAIGILVDFQATMPFLVLVLALLAVLPGADMTLFIVIMCIYGWERYTRLARSVALSAKESTFVQALTVTGTPAWRIYLLHILPNAMGVLLVNMSLNFPATILAETSLNFLGIGIQPPDTSLGVLMGLGRNHIYNAPWLALIPGLIILFATLSVSLIGDWLRDKFDQA